MFRWLRIAFSVLCGTVCLLLIVLWVRSCSGVDGVMFKWSLHRSVAVVSLLGEAGVAYVNNSTNMAVSPRVMLQREEYPHYPYARIMKTAYPRVTGRLAPFKPRLRWTSSKYTWYVGAPYWFLIMLTIAMGAMPWFQPSKRFSLRTLLIVMTLAAVGLGAIVYAVRSPLAYP